MGTFRVDLEIENPLQRGKRVSLRSVLIDTGAELSWFPARLLEELGVERETKVWRFRQVDGTVLERRVGLVKIYVAGTQGHDEVVFGEPNDIVLLGAHSLEALNLRVEPVAKLLVDAGPAPAVAAA
jgi:predicted aspartyl protease